MYFTLVRQEDRGRKRESSGTCEDTVNLRQWFPTAGVSQFPYKFAVNNGFSTKKKCPTLKLLLVILKDLGILRDHKMRNVYTFCCFFEFCNRSLFLLYFYYSV